MFRLRTDLVQLWPTLFGSCLTGLRSTDQNLRLTWLTETTTLILGWSGSQIKYLHPGPTRFSSDQTPGLWTDSLDEDLSPTLFPSDLDSRQPGFFWDHYSEFGLIWLCTNHVWTQNPLSFPRIRPLNWHFSPGVWTLDSGSTACPRARTSDLDFGHPLVLPRPLLFHSGLVQLFSDQIFGLRPD